MVFDSFYSAPYFQPFPEVPQALYQPEVEEAAQAVPTPQETHSLGTPNNKTSEL